MNRFFMLKNRTSSLIYTVAEDFVFSFTYFHKDLFEDYTSENASLLDTTCPHA